MYLKNIYKKNKRKKMHYKKYLYIFFFEYIKHKKLKGLAVLSLHVAALFWLILQYHTVLMNLFFIAFKNHRNHQHKAKQYEKGDIRNCLREIAYLFLTQMCL